MWTVWQRAWKEQKRGLAVGPRGSDWEALLYGVLTNLVHVLSNYRAVCCMRYPGCETPVSEPISKSTAIITESSPQLHQPHAKYINFKRTKEVSIARM